MEFSEWITKKYVEWRGNRVGRGSSIADFANLFGASQPVMSRWMKAGSGVPNRAKYVNALIEHYGDEAREILGIPKPVKMPEGFHPEWPVVYALDFLPPELHDRFIDMFNELTRRFSEEKPEAGSPEALKLANEIITKYGFEVKDNTQENSG